MPKIRTPATKARRIGGLVNQLVAMATEAEVNEFPSFLVEALWEAAAAASKAQRNVT